MLQTLLRGRWRGHCHPGNLERRCASSAIAATTLARERCQLLLAVVSYLDGQPPRRRSGGLPRFSVERGFHLNRHSLRISLLLAVEIDFTERPF